MVIKSFTAQQLINYKGTLGAHFNPPFILDFGESRGEILARIVMIQCSSIYSAQWGEMDLGSAKVKIWSIYFFVQF